jgi:predicted Fe-Mo cluster-binding NifX family protein
MKIAVASDNGITLTGHVGKCEMFIVFEVIKNDILNVERRLNTFTMHKTGNRHNCDENQAMYKHSGIIKGLKDCNYLFCSSGGHGLIYDLILSGVRTILTEEIEAEKAIKLFLENKLESDPNKKCKGHHHL